MDKGEGRHDVGGSLQFCMNYIFLVLMNNRLWLHLERVVSLCFFVTL